MSTVAETPSFDVLRKELDKRLGRRQWLETAIADTAVKHQAALDKALAEAPSKDPYRAGGEPRKLRDEQAKLEAKLNEIQPVIETLQAQVSRAGAAQEVEQVQAATARMLELFEEAEDLLREAGQVFVGEGKGLLPIWNDYALNRVARIELRSETEPLLQRVRLLDGETAAAWDELTDPEGLQPPKDIGAFAEMLVEIVFDPYSNGYRGGESDAIDAFGRVYKVDAGDKRFGRRLPSLLPDAHGHDRRIVGPGVERFAGAREPAVYSVE